jgi:dsRNA-specific ribonuclease
MSNNNAGSHFFQAALKAYIDQLAHHDLGELQKKHELLLEQIRDYTQAVFEVPSGNIELLRSVYVTEGISNYLRRVHNVQCDNQVGLSVLGDAFWDTIVYEHVTKHWSEVSGTNMVLERCVYTSNAIMTLVEKLLGTDRWVFAVHGADIINTKVMADTFEARIAYFVISSAGDVTIVAKAASFLIKLMKGLNARLYRYFDACVTAVLQKLYEDKANWGMYEKFSS